MRRLFITLLILTAASFGSKAQQFVFEKTDSVSGTFSAFQSTILEELHWLTKTLF
jgi:hypothetical protein